MTLRHRAALAAAAGALAGAGCGMPEAWPLSLAAITALSAGVIVSSQRDGLRSWRVVACGGAAWQLVALGSWAVLAVRTNDTLAWAWQAVVLLSIAVHHVACLLLTWLPLQVAARRLCASAGVSSAGGAAVAWTLAFAAADVLRQLGWMGDGYGGVGVALVDAPGVSATVPLIGAQGIGFVVVASCSALVVLAQAQRHATMAWLVGVVFAAAALASTHRDWTDARGDALDVLALDVGAPPAGRVWTHAQRDTAAAHLQRALSHAGPGTVVVTPETFFADPPPDEPIGVWGDVLRSVERRGAHVLVNMPQVVRDDTGRRLMNTVQQVSPGRRAFYAKERLVPGAEFLPWPETLAPMYRRMFERTQFGEVAGTPGLTGPLYVGGADVGASVCHEIAFAQTMLARSRASQVLINVGDDSWIPSRAFHQQMVTAARLRALETGRSLLRVSRAAPSTLVDHRGRHVPGLYIAGAGSTSYRVPLRTGATPFARAAPLIAAAPVVLGLGWCGLALLNGPRIRFARPVKPGAASSNAKVFP